MKLIKIKIEIQLKRGIVWEWYVRREKRSIFKKWTRVAKFGSDLFFASFSLWKLILSFALWLLQLLDNYWHFLTLPSTLSATFLFLVSLSFRVKSCTWKLEKHLGSSPSEIELRVERLWSLRSWRCQIIPRVLGISDRRGSWSNVSLLESQI